MQSMHLQGIVRQSKLKMYLIKETYHEIIMFNISMLFLSTNMARGLPIKYIYIIYS